MFKSLFTKNDKKTSLTAKVAFRSDIPADIAAHGTLYADNANLRLKNDPIPFAFLDVAQPPELDPDVLAHIWDQARAQGYNPLRLRSYATIFPVMPAPKARYAAPAAGAAKPNHNRH